ncbi:hypothetical protein [Cupriavidus sp. AU9028]|uniref:hypothetical protein n=1 Tax=Cupriavidus sp. AU9028 TaxID=2871157 RepID=UPI001C97741A|nr:hypothetical protein [Cupriavidus sp. AU9028]MBY4897567.1 hypothetical protein [Cupriavidus sp. AU9028]
MLMHWEMDPVAAVTALEEEMDVHPGKAEALRKALLQNREPPARLWRLLMAAYLLQATPPSDSRH